MDPKFTAAGRHARAEARAPTCHAAARIWGLAPRHAKIGRLPLTEAGRHLYVGRSNGLRGRYGRHCRPGATHRQAAFAFQLTRKSTGRTAIAYRAGEGSRAGLMLDPVFATAFASAKQRIREIWSTVTWKRPTKIARPCSKYIALSCSARRTTTLVRTDLCANHTGAISLN